MQGPFGIEPFKPLKEFGLELEDRGTITGFKVIRSGGLKGRPWSPGSRQRGSRPLRQLFKYLKQNMNEFCKVSRFKKQPAGGIDRPE